MTNYFVLYRADEYKIISCQEGQNPLYDYGSWDLFSGPFDSWEEAGYEANLVEEVREEA